MEQRGSSKEGGNSDTGNDGKMTERGLKDRSVDILPFVDLISFNLQYRIFCHVMFGYKKTPFVATVET